MYSATLCLSLKSRSLAAFLSKVKRLKTLGSMHNGVKHVITLPFGCGRDGKMGLIAAEDLLTSFF